MDWVYSLVRIPVPFIKLVYRYALFKAKCLNGEVVRKTLTLVQKPAFFKIFATEHNCIFKMSVQRYLILSFLAIRQNWLLTYKFEDCFQFRVWIEICNLTICQILYCILTLFLLKSNIFFLNPNLQLLYKYPPSFEPFSKSPKEREPIKVFIRFIGLSSSKLDRRS